MNGRIRQSNKSTVIWFIIYQQDELRVRFNYIDERNIDYPDINSKGFMIEAGDVT